MSSHIYTRRVFGPAIFTNTVGPAQFTVPAGEYWIVRWISVVNNSPTLSHLVRIGIGSSLNQWTVFRMTIPTNSQQQFDVRLPLSAGEAVYGTVDQAGAVTVTMTAYVFDVP